MRNPCMKFQILRMHHSQDNSMYKNAWRTNTGQTKTNMPNQHFHNIHEPPHDKTNKMTVRSAQTQISLGIQRPKTASLFYILWWMHVSNTYTEYIDPSFPVTCNEPPEVEHATHDGEPEQKSYPTGQQLMYSCAYGYSSNGHPRAMCSGEGEWVGLSLTCSRTFN